MFGKENSGALSPTFSARSTIPEERNSSVACFIRACAGGGIRVVECALIASSSSFSDMLLFSLQIQSLTSELSAGYKIFASRCLRAIGALALRRGELAQDLGLVIKDHLLEARPRLDLAVPPK